MTTITETITYVASATAMGTPAASLMGVTKNYGSCRALDGVDLRIEKGEVLALLGPNGAGKTTAVKLLLGLLKPSAGEARIFGKDPREASNRLGIGAMLQIASVPETLRVRELIDLFSSYYPRPLRLTETIAAAGLGKLENRFYGDLSGGEQRRALFALAICGNPGLLFLDEPTAGLDVEARRGMWAQIRLLRASGKSVLLTTHYLEEADMLADRVVVVQGGRVIANGTPASIKERAGGKVVHCTTSLTVDALRAMPFVESVRQDRDRVEIRSTNPDALVRSLIAQDETVHDIEITGGGMEEAFLNLLTRGEEK